MSSLLLLDIFVVILKLFTTRFFNKKPEFIKNLHNIESQKNKKLLQLNCFGYFFNKKLFFPIFDFLIEEVVLKKTSIYD